MQKFDWFGIKKAAEKSVAGKRDFDGWFYYCGDNFSSLT